MSTTVEKNNQKIFPKNEGKINSKGMVAPPIPPKSHQAKFAGIRAVFEQNAPHFQANDSNKTVSSNLRRTFGPIMRKFVEGDDININGSTNKLNAREKADSAVPKPNVMEKKDGKKVQSQSLSENDTFPESPACAYKPALFPKPSKEKINEFLGKNSYKALTSTSAQSTSRKSTPIWNPLNHNPVYIGKKPFNLDNSMSSNSSSCSKKSNISDISDKSNNSNIVRCNITRSNSKEDLRKPDASHNDKSAGKKLSNVNVSELIRKFEQGNEIIKGR